MASEIKLQVASSKTAGLVKGETTVVAVTVAATANAAPQNVPLAVVLILDCSGSMRLHANSVQRACEYIVTNLGDGSAVNVITFNADVRELGVIKLTPATRAQLLQDMVAAVHPHGPTNLGGALQAALVSAPAARAAASAQVCHVLLLTDGAANHGSLVEDNDMVELVNLHNKDVRITTVAYAHSDTGDVNLRLLYRLATVSGGAYHACTHGMDVAATFGDFVGSATSVVATINTVRVRANNTEVHVKEPVRGDILAGVPRTMLVHVPAASDVNTVELQVTAVCTIAADSDTWEEHRAISHTVTLPAVDADHAGDDVLDVTAHMLRRRVHVALAAFDGTGAALLLEHVLAHPHATMQGTALFGICAALRHVAENVACDWQYSQLMATQLQYATYAERGVGTLTDAFARPAAAMSHAAASQAAFDAYAPLAQEEVSWPLTQVQVDDVYSQSQSQERESQVPTQLIEAGTKHDREEQNEGESESESKCKRTRTT